LFHLRPCGDFTLADQTRATSETHRSADVDSNHARRAADRHPDVAEREPGRERRRAHSPGGDRSVSGRVDTAERRRRCGSGRRRCRPPARDNARVH
jgi:hypothetical protein